MILHGIDTLTNIRHDNTLSCPFTRITAQKTAYTSSRHQPAPGGTEEDGIENTPATHRTRETARPVYGAHHQAAQNHGRAAVVSARWTFFGEGMKPAETGSAGEMQTRTPSSACLTACLIPTPASKPTSSSSPRNPRANSLHKGSLSMSTPIRKAWSGYNKTKPMRFEEFQTEIDCGVLRPTASKPAKKPTSLESRQISRTSPPATTTSTSATPTSPKPSTTTPKNCWRTTEN